MVGFGTGIGAGGIVWYQGRSPCLDSVRLCLLITEVVSGGNFLGGWLLEDSVAWRTHFCITIVPDIQLMSQ